MNRNLAIAGALGGVLCAFFLTVGLPSFGFGEFSIGGCKSGADVKSSVRELPWSGGDEVQIHVPGTVNFHAGPEWRARVEGPAEAVEHLVFAHGNLEFDRPMNFCQVDLHIELTGPAVQHWRVHGSGSLSLQGLEQPQLDISLMGSGSARVNGRVERTRASLHGSGDLDLNGLSQSEIDLNIFGSGSISATGRVTRTSIDIKGSGDADLKQLTTEDADISIHGSGDVELAPEGKVDVQIYGSGDVRLAKKPHSLETRIHGSGRVM